MLTRTVDLNPRFLPAWEHLFWLAVVARDTLGAAERYEYDGAGSTASPKGQRDLDRLDYTDTSTDWRGRTGAAAQK